MALTFGFYNAVDHDRRYDAVQMSSIFDGIIQDGVYETIGDKFMVKQTTTASMQVSVGTGRAWFNHTWTLNDSLMLLTIGAADVTLGRIDAIVLEVNAEASVRTNSIKIVKGTASSKPAVPTLTNTETVHQYPLAYVTVNARTSAITQANIEYRVGQTPTPFVIGVLKVMKIDNFVAQWSAEWNEWLASKKTSAEAFEQEQETAFNDWFKHIKGVLGSDAAGNLQNEIDDLAEDHNKLGHVYMETTTLSVSNWKSGVYTINDSYAKKYVTSNSLQEILPATNITKGQMEALSSAMIVDNGQSAGSFTIKALDTVPTVDIPVRILFHGEGLKVSG